MSDFVHLHTHSEYSLLDGLGKLDHLIERAKSFGMEALALTDHGAMYGSFKFYLKAKAAGIKPIIGVETYVAKRSRFDKEARVDVDPYHLVLLAKNEKGYKNLMRLVTCAHLEGYYYKPRIDWEILQKYHDDIICLSACIQGQLPSLLRNNMDAEAEIVARQYAELFGPDHYYIELQKHLHIPDIDIVNEKLVVLAKKLGLPLVATNDIHYVDPDDAEAQEILLCVQTQMTIIQKNRKLTMIESPDFYMRSPDQMRGLFIQYPEAIDNTKRIAEMCDTKLAVGNWILPHFPLPEGVEDPAKYLEKLVWERVPQQYPQLKMDPRLRGDDKQSGGDDKQSGGDDKGKKSSSPTTEEINDRIGYELDIIKTKGYATYFLIVADFVTWAKSQGIAVGPGRGSAAGSVVSYALGITGIDPFYFKLPFERFLNPQRPTPPDIDLDFADDRRDEVIAYVTARYGKDKVAQIITYGTMEARGAVRDGGRALGLPYAVPDRIAKMIPLGFQGSAMTIEKALEQSGELARAYQTEPETRRLLDVARKLEGVARHASVHAAGVVIADKPLVEYTPLQRENKGERIITQYDMYTIGEDGVGLLKMDFLGLRNLTILSLALRFIKATRGVTVDLSVSPLDDKKTYAMLADGDTTGIFQLESAGMRRYIKELKPTTIFDLMAMVALFRPGPMQVIPEFIRRKHSPANITYPDPRLEEALSQSYGLICYQDDVLLTSIKLAGYSWGDADKLRKAVGKKIPSEMKKQKEKFIEGCVKNGLTKQKAEELFHLIEPFAGYGFNKAHAACYAMIAYHTAYLKAHFPVEYITAVLSAESAGASGPARDEKIALVVEECRRMNVTLLPPDINRSDVQFTILDGQILFGLSAVKHVGAAAIEVILAGRTLCGSFRSLAHVIALVDTSKVNKKVLESLIQAGAMDAFGNRVQLLSALPELLEEGHRQKKAKASGQAGLFDELGDTSLQGVISEKLPDVETPSKELLLSWEKELLGFYLTEHPLMHVLDQLKEQGATPIAEITADCVGSRVTIGGMVATVKHITTKVGKNAMVFVRLEDLSGAMELVIFPNIFAQTSQTWKHGTIVCVAGKVDEKDDRLTMLVDHVVDFTTNLA